MILSLKNLNRILFVLALFGIIISGYLLEKYLTGGKILCGLDQGCEIVQKSQFSNFFGIPVPLFGIIYYLCFLCLVILNTLYIIHNTFYKYLVLSFSILGAIISAVLFYIEVAIIHAVCVWCTASGLITVVLLGLSIYLLLRNDN